MLQIPLGTKSRQAVKLTTSIIGPKPYEADIQTSDPSKQTKPPAYPFSYASMSKSALPFPIRGPEAVGGAIQCWSAPPVKRGIWRFSGGRNRFFTRFHENFSNRQNI